MAARKPSYSKGARPSGTKRPIHGGGRPGPGLPGFKRPPAVGVKPPMPYKPPTGKTPWKGWKGPIGPRRPTLTGAKLKGKTKK